MVDSALNQVGVAISISVSRLILSRARDSSQRRHSGREDGGDGPGGGPHIINCTLGPWAFQLIRILCTIQAKEKKKHNR